jgi:glycogen debranching enzyme
MGGAGASHLVLSNGAAFAVLSPTGDIRTETNPEAGLFHDDTRYLSKSTLEIEGCRLRQLSSEVTREYVSQIDLSMSGKGSGGELDDPKLWFHLRRRQLIDKDLVERIELANYDPGPVDVTLLFHHEADFKDLFEVRGWRRAMRGTLHAAQVIDVATYEFHYTGRDGHEYRTRVRYERAPDTLEPGFASFRVHLEPLGSWSLEFVVIVGRDDVDRPRAPAPFARRAHRLAEAHAEWHAGATRITSPNRSIVASPTFTRSAFASMGCRPLRPAFHGSQRHSVGIASSAHFRP